MNSTTSGQFKKELRRDLLFIFNGRLDQRVLAIIPLYFRPIAFFHMRIPASCRLPRWYSAGMVFAKEKLKKTRFYKFFTGSNRFFCYMRTDWSKLIIA
jgi:hypothetical protein